MLARSTWGPRSPSVHKVAVSPPHPTLPYLYPTSLYPTSLYPTLLSTTLPYLTFIHQVGAHTPPTHPPIHYGYVLPGSPSHHIYDRPFIDQSQHLESETRGFFTLSSPEWGISVLVGLAGGVGWGWGAYAAPAHFLESCDSVRRLGGGGGKKVGPREGRPGRGGGGGGGNKVGARARKAGQGRAWHGQ